MRHVYYTTLFTLLISSGATAFQTDNTTHMAKEDSKRDETHPVASSEFDLMDSNKDGVVTEKEASDIGVNSLFSDMDINGDGVLSRKEYMNYREEDTPQVKEDF